ncbi:MAG: glutathione S-transferase family protein [Steroidobacteraceae bacterium]|nr:glutathione S-transferase family protein [Steroidobacteraceae bacterium]
MMPFELISNHLCPYTQRAAIQLAEKGLAYERTYIDLADKPAWFLQISPLGKVPILRVREGVVFETAVICEYIEEVQPVATPMLPRDPLDRARHRSWAEFASAIIADVFAFYMAADGTGFERKCGDLSAKFRWLERHLGEGPYFAGRQFQLVDAAFAPVFRLFDTFDRIGNFGVFKGLARVPAYRAALAERASVQRAVVSDYGALFQRYLLDRGSHLSRIMQQQSAIS